MYPEFTVLKMQICITRPQCFKLSTCFSLFVRPSSGHKIYVIRGSYTK